MATPKSSSTSSKNSKTRQRVSSSSSDKDNRKRVVQACDRCRLKKIKCDGSIPCERCRSEDAVCYFGCRRRDSEKTVPFAYVSQLEAQQRILVTALKSMYKQYCMGGPRTRDEDVPSVHKIVEQLGFLDDTCIEQILGYDEDCDAEDTTSVATLEPPPRRPKRESDSFSVEQLRQMRAQATRRRDERGSGSESAQSSAVSSPLLLHSPGLSQRMQYFTVEDDALTSQARQPVPVVPQQMEPWDEYQTARSSATPQPRVPQAFFGAGTGMSDELAEENWHAWINEEGG